MFDEPFHILQVLKLKFLKITQNETELFIVRWMDLESVTQSEVSRKEKNKYRMLTYVHEI